jgi:hypothetical protein
VHKKKKRFHFVTYSDLQIFVCSLLQKMAHNLRTTISPIYTDLLKKLLSLLPRSISPPVLTCLLETLSSLFRYLLIPSFDIALLDQTWYAICQVVTKCLNEAQRAVAEVWGSCLRQMKKEVREKSVVLLADRMGDIENTSAWVLVFACKVYIDTICFKYKFTHINSLYLKRCTHLRHQYLRLSSTIASQHVTQRYVF